jgi:hypothetical protein
MKNAAFTPYRLSPNAHYFGIGVVGDSIIDPDSSRNERYCEILDYQEFEEAVPIRDGDDYLEPIPESKRRNYWRRKNRGRRCRRYLAKVGGRSCLYTNVP